MSRRRPAEVAGVLFDCYGTLIDILTDEHDIRTYQCLTVAPLPGGQDRARVLAGLLPPAGTGGG